MIARIEDARSTKGPRAAGERPRVAMISTHGYVTAQPLLGAEDTGGQVVYVLELSRCLAAAGYDVDIFTRRFADQPSTEDVAEGVRILRVPCGGRDFIPKEYLYRHAKEWCDGALRLVRRNGYQYDFIDSHYWDAGVFADRLASQLNALHVHTPHSLGSWKRDRMNEDWADSVEAMERKYNFRERIAHERAVYRNAAGLIATSQLQFEILISDYDVPSEKVSVVPPGYDPGRFSAVSESARTAIRERLGWSDKRVILALGRLARNKGYDLLLDAFALVAPRQPDLHLHLAVGGDGRSAAEDAIHQSLIHKVREHGLEARVELAGYVADEDLPDLYRAADCFVLSSRYEPFGMTAVESMACGTPTVLTLHGGLHRAVVFGTHAMVADPLDPVDLANTIAKVFQLPDLHARLKRLGASRARAAFTWDSVARQLVAAVHPRRRADATGTFTVAETERARETANERSPR